MQKAISYFFSTVQGAIIIGSLFISLAVLVGSGVIKIGGGNSPVPVSPATKPQDAVGLGPTKAAGKVNVDLGHLPVKGNKEAKVTIIEFADFRCPFCGRFFKETEEKLMKDYVETGKVKFAFRHFAFLGPASTLTAEASECANEQGKFWEFHDWLYNNQADEANLEYYSKDNLVNYATKAGVSNTRQFALCLESGKYRNKVQDDLSAGQQAGVSGTPTAFVDGVPIVGAQPYSAFKTIIDQEFKK